MSTPTPSPPDPKQNVQFLKTLRVNMISVISDPRCPMVGILWWGITLLITCADDRYRVAGLSTCWIHQSGSHYNRSIGIQWWVVKLMGEKRCEPGTTLCTKKFRNQVHPGKKSVAKPGFRLVVVGGGKLVVGGDDVGGGELRLFRLQLGKQTLF